MRRIKKNIAIAVCAAVVLTAGLSATSISTADELSNKEILADLKQAEAAVKSKLEAMPAQTPEDINAAVEQGRKVKEAGLEAAALESTINPVDSRIQLEEDLRALKDVLATKGYYATLSNDPKYGEEYAKAAEILAGKKIKLAQIEKDLKENKNPVDQLIKEYEELRAQRELNINN
ncbi:hypothetical protein [Paenibacillus sp. YPG26]|uniref:hypothetical protein n=1 Tax=Paenibacillus sp. YPG26 TaxID=2878915 RepID=UPI00203ADD49|nr:hypothetical protein [Paenibacillus sp. YPG26]USB32390.1 hypothetical protein LDO05_13815 [Paenibacillus sp. YPG26]